MGYRPVYGQVDIPASFSGRASCPGSAGPWGRMAALIAAWSGQRGLGGHWCASAPRLTSADAVLAGDRAASADGELGQLVGGGSRALERGQVIADDQESGVDVAVAGVAPAARREAVALADLHGSPWIASCSRSSGTTMSSPRWPPRWAVTAGEAPVAPAPEVVRLAGVGGDDGRRRRRRRGRRATRRAARWASASEAVELSEQQRSGPARSSRRPGRTPAAVDSALVGVLERRGQRCRGRRCGSIAGTARGARPRRGARTAAAESGAGTKRSQTEVTTPSVPSEPTISAPEVVAGDVLAGGPPIAGSARRGRRDLEAGDPVPGHAVLERARAAGVGRDVAADLRLLGGARVGRETGGRSRGRGGSASAVGHRPALAAPPAARRRTRAPGAAAPRRRRRRPRPGPRRPRGRCHRRAARSGTSCS